MTNLLSTALPKARRHAAVERHPRSKTVSRSDSIYIVDPGLRRDDGALGAYTLYQQLYNERLV